MKSQKIKLEINDVTNKLPEELKAIYKTNPKNSPTLEGLKVAAALKLWDARGYRDIKFDVPLVLGGKRFFVKVLARNGEGGVVGVECASTLRLPRLRQRIADLQRCLPADAYIIAVFPETAGEGAKKAVKLVDEVWVTGKNGTVKQMMFSSVLHKE